ncbi:glycosyltransferase [Chloroflexota bacterium]
MNILQVADYFKYAWDTGGGIVKVAYDISRALVDRGHQITVFTTDRGLPKDIDIKKNQHLSIDGMDVYYFRNLSKYFARIGISIPYLSPIIIKRTLKTFDVIHIHNYRLMIIPIIFYYAQKYDIPYVIQAHGNLPADTPMKILKQIYDYSCGYKILKGASKVIALTASEAEQYKRMGVREDRIEIIPNGIDLNEFQNLPQRGAFRKRYGLGNDKKIILFLGRLHQIKGINILVKAFSGLPKSPSDIRLVIAGPDVGYLPTLQRLVKELNMEDEVFFPGALYGREKLEAYIDADMFVLPSIYETFPLVILEACACGLPIVVTDRCGIANMIDGQIGLVVPYDEKLLSRAILRMLDDDKMRREFGERGKSLVLKQLNWSMISERVEKVYLTL